MRVALVVATCLVTACDRSRPAREEPARPREVTMACDSAAAMATRAGARQVRVVADTLMATEGRGCAVVIDGFPDSASVPSAFFHRGFSRGPWRLNRYESPDAGHAYAVWQPPVFCNVDIHPGSRGKVGHGARDEVLGFDVLCTPLSLRQPPQMTY